MVQIQLLIGGGVMNPVIETVGDLIHRMSGDVYPGPWGYPHVSEKTERALRTLKSGYGFEKEHGENLQNNYEFFGERNENFRNQVSFEEYKKKIISELKKYSEAHAKLPVYNRVQWLARESAVAVGVGKYDVAITHLEKLLTHLRNEDDWEVAASEYKLDKREKLIQYNPTINEAFDPEKDKKIISVYKSTYDTEDMNNITRELNGFIHRYCKPWLQQGHGKIVYRGEDEHPDDKMVNAYTKLRSSGRKPQDTREEDQELFDRFLKRRKIQARRENSLIVTANYKEAMGYGDLIWTVFPIGQFKFTWSPEYVDLFLIMDQRQADVGVGGDSRDWMINQLSNNYITTDLPAAIDSHHEIMLYANKYLFVHPDMTKLLNFPWIIR